MARKYKDSFPDKKVCGKFSCRHLDNRSVQFSGTSGKESGTSQNGKCQSNNWGNRQKLLSCFVLYRVFKSQHNSSKQCICLYKCDFCSPLFLRFCKILVGNFPNPDNSASRMQAILIEWVEGTALTDFSRYFLSITILRKTGTSSSGLFIYYS